MLNRHRARLPSLYSDFTLQRSSNPDGFVANVSAWENALRKAAQAGLIPAPDNGHDTLSLRTGEELLQALTTKEWGRPLALGTVIVGNGHPSHRVYKDTGLLWHRMSRCQSGI